MYLDDCLVAIRLTSWHSPLPFTDTSSAIFVRHSASSSIRLCVSTLSLRWLLLSLLILFDYFAFVARTRPPGIASSYLASGAASPAAGWVQVWFFAAAAAAVAFRYFVSFARLLPVRLFSSFVDLTWCCFCTVVRLYSGPALVSALVICLPQYCHIFSISMCASFVIFVVAVIVVGCRWRCCGR